MKSLHFSGTTRLILLFIFLSITGAFLLQLPCVYKGQNVVPFIDALFTAVSAVCVTGLSTVDMNIYTNFGFLVILILIELGGLGIITFLSIFISAPGKRVSLVNRRVVKQFSIDELENNPRKIIKNIIFYTLSIQFAGFLLLIPLLKSHSIENYIFDALFLSVSSFCNAGFSPYSDSLIQFDNAIALNVVISGLIILGGIGFIVINNIIQVKKRIKKRTSMHTKIVLISTAILIISGFLYYFTVEFNHAFKEFSLCKKVSAAFFQAVTPRTCGFESVAQSDFSRTSSLFTLMLMFIGGSPASIAGGIKTTTFFIAIWYVFRGNEKTGTVQFDNRTISKETINKSIIIIIKSVIIIFLGVFFLTITEKSRLVTNTISMFDLAFETVSAFGTVGLSQGITANMSFWGKIVLIITMFIGRTALATMMIILPGIIKKRQFIEYPEEEVIVG